MYIWAYGTICYGIMKYSNIMKDSNTTCTPLECTRCAMPDISSAGKQFSSFFVGLNSLVEHFVCPSNSHKSSLGKLPVKQGIGWTPLY